MDFDALLDERWHIGRSEAHMHQPRDAATRGSAGGGVFAAIELHPRVPLWCRGIMRIHRRDAVAEFCMDRIQPCMHLARRGLQALRGLQVTQQHNADGRSGGDRLWRVLRGQIVKLQTQHRGHGGSVMRISEDRVELVHGRKDSGHTVLLRSKVHCDGANVEPQRDRLGALPHRMVQP